MMVERKMSAKQTQQMTEQLHMSLTLLMARVDLMESNATSAASRELQLKDSIEAINKRCDATDRTVAALYRQVVSLSDTLYDLKESLRESAELDATERVAVKKVRKSSPTKKATKKKTNRRK